MVVAIMGILMGIGFAVAPGVLKSSAMSGGLSQVASAVSLARSEAIRSRNPTYFVLAPTNSLDERSFRSYSIIQATSPRSTNFTYVSRWEKLPQAVLFKLDQVPMSNRLPTMNFPYPTDAGASNSMAYIAFQGDGALLEDLHTVGNLPRIALQTGVRINPGDAPTYQGSYLTNEVGVRRVTGKVFVEREK